MYSPPGRDEPIPVAKRLHLHDDDEDDMEDEDDIMKQYVTHPQGEGQETHPLASGVLSGCGGVSISKLFSHEDFTIAVRVVRENGGTVVQPPSAQYLIAPLEWAGSKWKGVGSELEKVDGLAVTMIWLVNFNTFLILCCHIVHCSKEALKRVDS